MDTLLYALDSADALIERDLDGLTLIYHQPSGITHIVDSPIPEILSVLEKRPQSSWSVLERLLDRFDVADDQGTFASLERHLAELTLLGLVRAQHAA